MPKIRLLSQHLINQIAAGEVVERPASVAKELIENSLDAGAKQITLEIEDGGKKLIKVTDDGCGMEPEDIALAVTAHATSKLQNENDLFAIKTLGFRGEALASIAVISQLEIVSRTKNRDEGFRLAVSGGQQKAAQPAAAAEGTTISVRNLFFNTPARRKFLRTTNTEMGHILEQFTRIALANTNVQMTLTHNGRLVHKLSAGQPTERRIAALFSEELAQSLIPVRREHADMKIRGLAATPRQSRAAGQWQYVFVNGRNIRDRFVNHAIKQGYQGLLEINKQPVVFLFIEMAPEMLDVNVHPAKTEVRFANSNAVHSQVVAAIRDQLLNSDLSTPLQEDKTQDRGENDRENQQQRQQNIRQAMSDFFKSAPPPPWPSQNRPEYSKPQQYRHDTAYASRSTEKIQPIPQTAVNSERIAQHETLSEKQRRFIQIHDSYLVAQSDDGLIIVDQHALHERIIFQQLKELIEKGPLPSQRCLIPETVDLKAEQMAFIEKSTELLAELGIELEQFGPRTVAIQAYPTAIERVGSAKIIPDMLDIIVSRAGQISREELLHQVLDTMACKAAVKAGDRLTDSEIENLLGQLEKVERSSHCPHGRPTTIRLSKAQLEKQFKRT